MAVVLENEMAARPHSGLADADVIYEAVAEFNLTRFVAVYWDSSPEAVGPVRSGRDYHAAIAAEYEALLVHCLDVPTLPNVVAQTKVVNMDGCRMTSPPGFWRSSGRSAPHNLYVSLGPLRAVAGKGGTYGGLARRQDWPTVGDRVNQVSFVYPEQHPILWTYDAERKEYLRSQDGSPHLDATGKQVSASSVVVQFVEVRPAVHFGEAGYHELTLTGEGDAILYAAGVKYAAQWRRGQLMEPTHFFHPSGEELLLPPGRVFFQLVSVGAEVVEN